MLNKPIYEIFEIAILLVLVSVISFAIIITSKPTYVYSNLQLNSYYYTSFLLKKNTTLDINYYKLKHFDTKLENYKLLLSYDNFKTTYSKNLTMNDKNLKVETPYKDKSEIIIKT